MRLLAERTEGKSSSDLKELCRNAAMSPVRETIRRAEGDFERLARDQEKVRLPFSRFDYSVTCWSYQGFILRPLTIEDFF
jgi:SpoVK/Ycf46/Vps4 family AAA+-type ATPase